MRIENPRPRPEAERALVGFHVGDGYYAVEVPAVREIISPVALVAVPHSPDIVRGVTDHRGRVVPIVDLRLRFGLPPAGNSRRTKWIIVEASGQWMGLIVDDVTEVFAVTSANERQAPQLGPDDVARGFARVFVYEQQIVMVLDLEILGNAVSSGGGSVPPPRLEPSVRPPASRART